MEQNESFVDTVKSDLDVFSKRWSYTEDLSDETLMFDDERHFRCLDVIPDPEFYYVLGVIPKSILGRLQVEWQKLFFENAWNYIKREMHPEQFSEEVKMCWAVLDELHANPPHQLTDIFTRKDLVRMGVSDEDILSFCPDMDHVINSLMHVDFKADIPVLEYFHPELCQTVERFRETVQLYTKYRDRFVDEEPVLYNFDVLDEEQHATDYERQVWRLNTVTNVLIHYPHGHAALDAIYEELSDTYRHFCARALADLKIMELSKHHPEMRDSIIKMVDYFQTIVGEPVDDKKMAREITTALLNVRYVLEKTTDKTALPDVLDWYDTCVFLTPEEQRQYRDWDIKRRIYGKPCFVPGDGFTAGNNTALTTEGEKRYREDLDVAWRANHMEHLVDLNQSETSIVMSNVKKVASKVLGDTSTATTTLDDLPTLEYNLGTLEYNTSALRWLYLLGILTRSQYRWIEFTEEQWLAQENEPEKEWEKRETINPMKMSMLDAYECLKHWGKAPLDVPINKNVVNAAERLMGAVRLYADRFCEDTQNNYVMLADGGQIAEKLEVIAPLHLKGGEAEVDALSGLISIWNGLDPERKNADIHNLLDLLVRDFYRGALVGLRLVAEDMPKRQRKQMDIALTALEKVEDRTVFVEQKGQCYARILGAVRSAISNPVFGNTDQQRAAREEFDMWVYPVQQYWCSSNYVIRSNRWKSGDNSDDNCLTR